MPLGICPTVDFVFKFLFGQIQNTDLLIHLLNSVLVPESPIEEVVILNPYNDKEFDDDKLSIVDVKARDSAGVWYVIEVQTTIPDGLKQRLVFYTSELFAGQMREGDSYASLQPAISICFLTESLFDQSPAGHFRFSLCDPVNSVSLGDQVQVHIVELAKYNLSDAMLGDADWLEKWVYFMKESANRDAEELRRLLPSPTFQKATGILEMIARDDELRYRYADRAKEAKDRFSFLKDARDAAMAKGLEQGEARGKLIGRIQLTQRLLKMPAADDASLKVMETKELETLASDLETRLNDLA
ncbi:PD-(D/E)XK nuclease family transposase [Rubripirellula obstinata]|uniref:PD-(D/E)XK nuclease family transposase n=1 Tax=Rubripirellula obstinata TaxID=406547 RepID=A0A5B1CC00_9BACT|nr:Rpn family recombination-promoting nuclease/putative transposase [Rubripirellula obstinata]KAA1257761.1 PD-(D/E)XK nuclease family transposase [Rubripirellula obstinata]